MLYIRSNSHNVIIPHFLSILITWTEIQPCCTLRTPFDIVLNALFNFGYDPKRSLPKNTRFTNVVISRVPRHDYFKCFPFTTNKNGIPPRARRSPKKDLKNSKLTTKTNTNAKENGVPARPPERGVRGRAAPEKLQDFISGRCR